MKSHKSLKKSVLVLCKIQLKFGYPMIIQLVMW